MRVLIALAVSFAGVAGPVAAPAMAQGLSDLDAINRCESFVESSMRPELGAEFKHPYKVVCYFGLIDPGIHDDHDAVCARVSRPFRLPFREIAEFMCKGAYEAQMSAADQ